jgi:CDP-glycerol glycerophosphotransferase
MPRVSVVVPIYNVEPYLERCLDSLAGQTYADLEIVMVNDGSTDRSAEIAEAFSARDPRFRLVEQPNRGLSAARNTGIDQASGEFLAFADSDDIVAPAAYELLVGALDESGSDLATGNVHRLSSTGSRQVGFLANAFAETRLGTHIRRDRRLMHDRMAWNKLWRRSFWDREGRRFPEGRIFEDTPVTLPLHFAARAVDVISDVVYYWRLREGADLSITQRRTEPKALRDRLTAIQEVSDYLRQRGLRWEKRYYDRVVVGDDLRHYVNVLDEADDEYRQLFFDSVNAFLDGVSPWAFRRLPATERLKWQLVRRRMLPELLEILRFQREDLPETAPVKVRGHWYLDHPYRTDRRLKLRHSLFRVDRELRFSTGIDVLDWQDGKLRIEGWAFLDGVGAPDRRSQRITLTALPRGRMRALRLRAGGVRVKATPVHRPELVAASGTELADVSWAGFAATLDARRLGTKPHRRDLYITVRNGLVWRARSRFGGDSARPLRAAEAVLANGTAVATAPAPTGEVALHVRTEWAIARAHRLDGDVLELTGDLRVAGAPKLQARRRRGKARHAWPLETDGTRFTARVPLADLDGADAAWELWVGKRRLALDAAEPAGAWRHGGREIALERAMDGGAMLTVRPPRGTITRAEWRDDGSLELAGELRADDARELVLEGRHSLERHAFPLAPGELAVRITPGALPSLAGERPLRADVWALRLRGGGAETPVTLSPELYDRLPLTTVLARKRYRVGMDQEGDAILLVERDLDDDERGRRQQRRLRATAYADRRAEPLRDAVLFVCRGGRRFAGDPRAIHAELVRRGAPLEQLWVVRDGRARVPHTAAVVRASSREHYEALAQARFVVTDDHFPEWFQRREDQVCLQTWHGTPVRRLGREAPAPARADRRYERMRERQAPNWQYVVAQNALGAEALERAYAPAGEILVTGAPRTDALAGDGLARLGAETRRRLGIPDGVRVVLYAPTFRETARDSQGRRRLDGPFDPATLRAALGDDAVVLFRPHPTVYDPAPASADGFVRDVTDYPDAMDLLAAADVLVTDYSSLLFDYAGTGRPMVFFAYDLDVQRGGFTFDYEARVPGPVTRTTAALAEALRDLDGVAAEYAERRRAFAAEHCALDDGGAAARVVDRVFGG